MSNCQNSANSQLKALNARLDRIDDDLIAQYAGISQLVAGLAANPLTSGSVAVSLRTFNFNAAGQTLLKKLVGLIPGVDTFRSLQNLDAAALIDGMGDRVAAQAIKTADAALEQVTEAAMAHAQAITARAEAAAALANAIAQGVSEADRAILEAGLAAADGLVAGAAARLQGVNQIAQALNGFMGCLSDISNCQTRSSVIE